MTCKKTFGLKTTGPPSTYLLITIPFIKLKFLSKNIYWNDDIYRSFYFRRKYFLLINSINPKLKNFKRIFYENNCMQPLIAPMLFK